MLCSALAADLGNGDAYLNEGPGHISRSCSRRDERARFIEMTEATAFVEGWALYAETCGRARMENDPYRASAD